MRTTNFTVTNYFLSNNKMKFDTTRYTLYNTEAILYNIIIRLIKYNLKWSKFFKLFLFKKVIKYSYRIIQVHEVCYTNHLTTINSQFSRGKLLFQKQKRCK